MGERVKSTESRKHTVDKVVDHGICTGLSATVGRASSAIVKPVAGKGNFVAIASKDKVPVMMTVAASRPRSGAIEVVVRDCDTRSSAESTVEEKTVSLRGDLINT